METPLTAVSLAGDHAAATSPDAESLLVLLAESPREQAASSATGSRRRATRYDRIGNRII
jgi:hypothetical protein